MCFQPHAVSLTTIAHIADGWSKNSGELFRIVPGSAGRWTVPLAVFLDGLEDRCGNE